jgi:hypothetical protein
VLWLRADIAVGLNGSNVASWGDQSGQANNATTSNHPTYGTVGGANGQPYLNFTSVSVQYLGGTSTVTASQPLEYLIVCRPTASTPATSSYLFDCGMNNNAMLQGGVGVQLSQYDGIQGNYTTVTQNADIVVDSYFNGASSTLTINNGAVAGPANTSTASPSGAYTIGNVGSHSAHAWGGYIYEIIVYARQLLATEKAVIRAYVLARYGF